MKQYILIIMLVLPVLSKAQIDRYHNSYVCANGKAHFLSSAPFGNIAAVTNSSACVLNTQTKEVAVKIPISSFHFDQELMKDQFNEYYLESDIYPNAVFDAAIVENIDFTKDGVYNVILKGELEIHGVKQQREVHGKLTVLNGEPVKATASFNVALDDHKIKVPMALSLNIADVIQIDVDFTLEKYRRDELTNDRSEHF